MTGVPATDGGSLVSIHAAEKARAPMVELREGWLVAGRGLRGDRYFEGRGEFSPAVPDPDHEITLVALEEVERFRSDAATPLAPGDLRRNLVTRGVDLAAWVGREFAVGGARLRGIRLCEPCGYLAELVDPEVLRRLVHRAGLRAAVVRGARVRPGDPVRRLD